MFNNLHVYEMKHSKFIVKKEAMYQDVKFHERLVVSVIPLLYSKRLEWKKQHDSQAYRVDPFHLRLKIKKGMDIGERKRHLNFKAFMNNWPFFQHEYAPRQLFHNSIYPLLHLSRKDELSNTVKYIYSKWGIMAKDCNKSKIGFERINWLIYLKKHNLELLKYRTDKLNCSWSCASFEFVNLIGPIPSFFVPSDKKE